MKPSAPALVFAVGALTGVSMATTSPFYSQIHSCPQSCTSVGLSSSNWTSYHSFDRLERCSETVLFDFNVFNQWETQTSIRACTVERTRNSSRELSSCTAAKGVPATLQLVSWSTSTATETASSILEALEALENQVASERVCGRSSGLIHFATHGKIVIGLYMGSLIDSTVAVSVLSAQVLRQLQDSNFHDTVAAQVCGTIYDNAHTLGLIVSTAGDYEQVQLAVQGWANATCLSDYDHATSANITISELPVPVATDKSSDQNFNRRDDTCSYVFVVSGDSCATLASKCDITAAELSAYNPSSTLCSSLAIGEIICCSEGSQPDLSPQPTADGLCYSYTVKSGDYCYLLASEYYITTDEIEEYNTQTWGWMGCNNLQLGSVICLSSGDPPMPAVISNAECGPQVNGSTRPSDWSNISSLNPCPLNACVRYAYIRGYAN